MRGKTFTIYLPDADLKGIKICDINNSIVKGVSIPRTQLKEVMDRKELEGPGIYFLLGEKGPTGKHQIYIGEAENLLIRIGQHNKSKDFWNSVICFISEKRNINKAHIKFLENYTYMEAKRINKCELENGSIPTASSLTEQDQDFVLSFFDDMKLILTTLGFPIFEEGKKEQKNLYYCKLKDADAIGEYSEDGFTVFKGSKSNLIEAPSAGECVINTRKNLLDNGILEEQNGIYVFVDEYTFSSPSAAATNVLARRAKCLENYLGRG